MEDERQIPEPIQWDQGVLLTPRHFLEMAGRYERLQQEIATLRPFGWGIRQLVLSDGDIQNGKIEVRRCEAIFPDGTYIDAVSGDIAPLHLEKEKVTEVNVWLSLPPERNFSWKGDTSRYQSAEDGDQTEPIDRLRPQVALKIEKPKVGILICRMVRSRASTELVNEQVPPWISVPGDSPLIRMCTNVKGLLRRKVDLLVNQIRNPLESLTGVPELRERLRSVSGGLPWLESLLNAGAGTQHYGHPFQLFQALCLIAGHVGILGEDLAPPDLPAYDHENLLAVFQQVEAKIEAAVNQGVSEQWVAHPLDSTHHGFQLESHPALKRFKVNPDHWPSIVIGFREGSGQAKHAVVKWAENCRIATGDIARLQQARVPGARRHAWADPSDLTAPAGVQLFAIAKGDQSLDFSETLHVIGEPILPGAAVLYLRDPKRETVPSVEIELSLPAPAEDSGNTLRPEEDAT